MHHLGVGYTHRNQPVIVLIDATTATVIHRITGEILSRHDIDPDQAYWRNNNKSPFRQSKWRLAIHAEQSAQGG